MTLRRGMIRWCDECGTHMVTPERLTAEEEVNVALNMGWKLNLPGIPGQENDDLCGDCVAAIAADHAEIMNGCDS